MILYTLVIYQIKSSDFKVAGHEVEFNIAVAHFGIQAVQRNCVAFGLVIEQSEIFMLNGETISRRVSVPVGDMIARGVVKIFGGRGLDE